LDFGPFANMPGLFPKSILGDPKGFKTVVHAPEYFPPAHALGWRTSILRPYTVTYSYDATLTRRMKRNRSTMKKTNRRSTAMKKWRPRFTG